MQRLALLMILVVASLATPSWSYADDASDRFLVAYQNFQTADKLVGEGSLHEALAKYESVREVLLDISQNSPEWQPLVVEYRLKKTQENITRLEAEVADLPPRAEAIEGELPEPDRGRSVEPVISTSPVVSVRPPRGASNSRQTRTPKRRTSNSAQDQMQELRDQLSNARQENERLNARLLSALVEVDKTKVTVVDLRSQLAQATATLENTRKDSDDFSSIREEFDKRVVGLLQKLTDVEADREVLREENERLFVKLERAATYISTSDGIRENLLEERTQLAAARDVAIFQGKKEVEEGVEKIDLLTQENEKLKNDLTFATKDMVSQAEVDRLKAENSSLSEALAAADSGGVSAEEHGRLVEEKEALVRRLAAAESVVEKKRDVPTPEKDALIAELQSDLNSVNDRLLEAQAQLSGSEDQIQNLKKQLDETSGSLAEVKLNPEPTQEETQLATENELLRGIILRQIKGQTFRDEARKGLEQEIASLEIKSDVITRQLEVLGAPVLNLTPAERTLFKEPVALLNEPDPNSLTVTMAVVKPKATPPEATSGEQSVPVGGPQSGGQAVAATSDFLPEDVREMVVQAKALFEKMDYVGTEKVYQEIVDRVPNNYFALSNLAAVQIEAGKLAAAEVALKKAVEINDQDSFAFTNLGILYSRQGRIEEATEALTQALALNDADAVAHNYLGVCLGQGSKREEAEQQFKKAIELNGAYPDAHFNLAVLYATTEPQLMELAKHYYIKATELGAAPDPSLESLIQ